MWNCPTSECLQHHSSTSREVSFGSTKPTLWRLRTRVYDQPEGLDSCCMISGLPQQCDWLPPSCSMELAMGFYAEPSLAGRCWEQGWTACPISSTLWHPGYCVPAQGEQAGQRLPETFWLMQKHSWKHFKGFCWRKLKLILYLITIELLIWKASEHFSQIDFHGNINPKWLFPRSWRE